MMDHLSIDTAHLVGHSMGGLVCGRTAIDHPGRAASLTLICSAGLGADINAGYIDGFTAASSRKELKPVLRHLFADKSLVSRSMTDDLLKYKRLDGVAAFLEALKGNLFADGRQAETIVTELSAFDGPVQVIWGQTDEVIPQSHADAIAGAAVTVIAEAGHMVQMENAGRVNDLIRERIRS